MYTSYDEISMMILSMIHGDSSVDDDRGGDSEDDNGDNNGNGY